MANTVQAKKRARQAEMHRERNTAQRSMLRSAIKTVRVAADKKDKGAAQKAFRDATSVIDRMARKGLIHKNAAARYKERLERQAAYPGKDVIRPSPANKKDRRMPVFLFLHPPYITTILSRWISSGSSTYPKMDSIRSLGLPIMRRASSAP